MNHRSLVNLTRGKFKITLSRYSTQWIDCGLITQSDCGDGESRPPPMGDFHQLINIIYSGNGRFIFIITID